MKGWWPWLVVACGIILLIVGILHGQAAIASVAPLIAGWIAWAHRTSRPQRPPSDRDMRRAAAALRTMVSIQWSREAAARGLAHPGTLTVRWRDAQLEAGDHPRLAGGPVDGSTGDMASFVSLFLGLCHQRMVVCGGPGEGKTTLTVLVARELLGSGKGEVTIPVLFPLDSWDPGREPLYTWLCKRLSQDYPAVGKSELLMHLIVSRQVLPVLDGLDDLPERARATALTRINRALADDGPIILTSRTTEFQLAVSAADVIRCAAVVTAVPVGVNDAVGYLKDAVSPRRSAAWIPVFAAMVCHPDGPLAIALSVPLNIWLARTVYADRGSDPSEMTRFASPTALQDHLLDAVIPALYTATSEFPADVGPAPYPARQWDPEQARVWLGFLATHITRLGTRDLAWWQLHRAVPDRLRTRLVPGLVLGILFGLGAGLAGYLEFGYLGMLVTMPVMATAIILLLFLHQAPPVENPHRLPKKIIIITAPALVVGAEFGCFLSSWAPFSHVGDDIAIRLSGAAAGVLVSTLMTGLAGLLWRLFAGSIAMYGLYFWLGGSTIIATKVGLSTWYGNLGLYETGRVTLGSMLLFAIYAILMMIAAGVAARLRRATETGVPAYLDLRPGRRLWQLVRSLPEALGRGALVGIILGSILGLGSAAVLFISGWLAQTPILSAGEAEAGLDSGLSIGLVPAVGLAIIVWARRTAAPGHSDPMSTLRGDRLLTLISALLGPVSAAFAGLLYFWFARLHPVPAGVVLQRLLFGPIPTVILGTGFGLVFAAPTAYASFAVARIWLASTGVLPVRLMAFFEDAHKLGVFRKSGPVYQFRHARLQDRLAKSDPLLRRREERVT